MPQLHQVAEPYVPDGRILSELRALAQSTRWWVAWCRDFSNTPKLTSALNTALEGLIKFACELEALRKRQTAYPTIISHSTTGQWSYSNEVMDYSILFLGAMDPSEWVKGSIGPAGRQELEETLWNEAEEKFRLVQDMATSREHHLDLARLAAALGAAAESVGAKRAIGRYRQLPRQSMKVEARSPACSNVYTIH
uniref:Uncharacterized protein n=1 Tax=Bionectria ochroleuca TaxID=29856 RepID=A0A8H7MYE2_BIOOC